MKKIKAYCRKCHKWKFMKDSMPEKIGIGKKMGFTGSCPDCGRYMFILDKPEYIQRMWGK